MNELTILIDHGQTAFTPESVLSGVIRWQLEVPPRGLRLQLMWYTSGKGTTDIHLEESLDFSSSQITGSESFRFTLPSAPYSFSGKYISLHWALELVSQPGSLNTKTEFILSPDGKEILLPQIQDSRPKASFGQFKLK